MDKIRTKKKQEITKKYTDQQKIEVTLKLQNFIRIFCFWLTFAYCKPLYYICMLIQTLNSESHNIFFLQFILIKNKLQHFKRNWTIFS